MKNLKSYDLLISLGEMFIDKKPDFGCDLVYINTSDNEDLKRKYNFKINFIKYEIASEEAIILLLLYYFSIGLKKDFDAFLSSLDIGYLSAESNISEEEFEDLKILCEDKNKRKKNVALLISKDIFLHKNVKNIKALLAKLDEFKIFDLILPEGIKLQSNSLAKDCEVFSYDGTVLYSGAKSFVKNTLFAGTSFARLAKIKDKDKINICFECSEISADFALDTSLKGAIAFYSSENDNILTKNYPYKKIKITKNIK